MTRTPVQVFATFQSSDSFEGDLRHYLPSVREAARAMEAAGCRGGLIYSDNGTVSPWIVAQEALHGTEALVPLVALQPVYEHPYRVANIIASFARLYGRRIALNLVAGGFRNDLVALGDDTAHDLRYDRLREYAEAVMELLSGGTVTRDGRFVQLANARLSPRLPADLLPELYMSGSSPAGRAAAQSLGAVPIEYPEPLASEHRTHGNNRGLRIGLVVGRTSAEAWAFAYQRFPADRAGQVRHRLASRVTDSHWHNRLRNVASGSTPATYWLGPFENSQSMCPYLVGDRAEIVGALRAYVDRGYTTFVLDEMAVEDLEFVANLVGAIGARDV